MDEAITPRTVRWLAPAAVYLAIVAVSFVPGEALAQTPDWMSVAGHVTEYAALGAAIRWSLGRGPAPALTAIALTAVLGLANEVQQALVPGRFPDFADLVTDIFGATVGIAAFVLIRRARGGSFGTVS